MANNLLKGKKGIIFGALNDQSIAWKAALKAHEEGAELVLTNTPVSIRLGTINALAEECGALVVPADATSLEDLGTLVSVLVEGSSKRDGSVMVGHSEKNQTVHFELPEGRTAEELVGSIVDVRVEEARTWYLRGTVEGDPR